MPTFLGSFRAGFGWKIDPPSELKDKHLWKSAILLQTVFFLLLALMPNRKALGIATLIVGGLLGAFSFDIWRSPPEGGFAELFAAIILFIAAVGAACGLVARATSLIFGFRYLRGADACVMAVGLIAGPAILKLIVLVSR